MKSKLTSESNEFLWHRFSVLVNASIWLVILFSGSTLLFLQVSFVLGFPLGNGIDLARKNKFEGVHSFLNTPKQSCHLNITTKKLICNGSLDLWYLRQIRHFDIDEFIVNKYTRKPLLSSNDIPKSRKWYLELKNLQQKFIGKIHLKKLGLQINLIFDVMHEKNLLYNYTLKGEAFSTKGPKIFEGLQGNFILTPTKNGFIASINLQTTDSRKFNLMGEVVQAGNVSPKYCNEWVIRGWVKSDYATENKTIFFSGWVNSEITNEDSKYSGDVYLENINFIWEVEGKMSSPICKGATIPRAAFSKMFVKNIIFRNSEFFNDFDKNVFEGLSGIETVSFLSSKLEVMPKLNELLKSLMGLRELFIEDCVTPELRFGNVSIVPLEYLQKISFKGTGPLHFNDDSFLWLQKSNVTYLNLRNTFVVLLPESVSVCKGISHSLQHLDISHSNLRAENDLSTLLKDLKLVSFAAEGLLLKRVPTKALDHIKSTLERLSLRGNDFEKIFEENIFKTTFDFPLMEALFELDLSECQINYLERGAFDLLPNLAILILSGNSLENIQDGWSFATSKITHLDFSFNRLNPRVAAHSESNQFNMALDQTLDLSGFINLRYLNLTGGIFRNPDKMIRSLRKSLRELILTNTNLENVSKDTFSSMTGLEVLDLSYHKNLKLNNVFLTDLFGKLTNLKTLNLRECGINSLFLYAATNDIEHGVFEFNANNTVIILKKLESLDLSRNNIKMVNSAMLSSFPNLKSLRLSGNRIATWEIGTFRFGQNLDTSIFLDENKIEIISEEMREDLMKFKFVKLGNNPFICRPYVHDISEMARNETRNPRKKPIILDWSDKNYMCFSKAKNQFVPFRLVDETFESARTDLRGQAAIYENAYLWILVAVIFGIVFTMGIFCWKWLDIHMITKAVRNAVILSSIGRGNREPETYKYDVFVSFSDKNRQWVIEMLIPKLQSNKDIKVCLHERDFQVGLSILENIISSIDNSCNILLVLSKAFLKSHWCQYEMHLAQHRLLEKGRDQLILIFLEDIPLMKRPRILRYLMMTQTYLEWPANSKNQKNEIEVFWSRLLKTLKI